MKGCSGQLCKYIAVIAAKIVSDTAVIAANSSSITAVDVAVGTAVFVVLTSAAAVIAVVVVVAITSVVTNSYEYSLNLLRPVKRSLLLHD